MYSISNKISLLKQAPVAKSNFSNDEIIPSAVVQFSCCDCGHENTVEITPYETGFPVIQLYEAKVLSGDELLKNRVVSETSQNMIHFGKLTVSNLPTLYFGTDCIFCNSKYICIFSYGEKQPGLTLLTVSGIWMYDEI